VGVRLLRTAVAGAAIGLAIAYFANGEDDGGTRPPSAGADRACPSGPPPAEAGLCFDVALEEEWPPRGDIDVRFGILSDRTVGEGVELNLRITNRTGAHCRYTFDVASNDYAAGEPEALTVTVEGELAPGEVRDLVERTPRIDDPHPLFETRRVIRNCRPPAPV
jgi:hypothetical protein